MTTETLIESIKLESLKRKPMRRSGRILLALREIKKRELIKRMNDETRAGTYSYNADSNVSLRRQIQELDRRINGYFVREDQGKQTLPIFTMEEAIGKTNLRTRVEFIQGGRTWRALWIGGIESAKIGVARRRGATFLCAHCFSVEYYVIQGMWQEIEELKF